MFKFIKTYLENKRIKENRLVLLTLIEIRQNSCVTNCYAVMVQQHLRNKHNIKYPYAKLYNILERLTELDYVTYRNVVGSLARGNRPKRVYSIKNKGYVYLAEGGLC